MNAPETASKAGNKTITTLKEHIIEIISDSGAVSYTHLDVYKRQE